MRRGVAGLLLAVACAAAGSARAQETETTPRRYRIGVMSVAADATLAEDTVAVLDELLLSSIQSAWDWDVLGQRDVEQMLGFDQRQQLLGCQEDTCQTGSAAAVPVDELVTGRVARVGGVWVVTLKRITLADGKVRRRVHGSYAGDAGVVVDGARGLAETLMDGGPMAPGWADVTPMGPVPVYQTWWFWTGIAVVAAVAGGVAWAQSRPKETTGAVFEFEVLE